MREDARHEEFGAHRRERLGHDQEARLNRRESEADLVEQRQEKRHAADAEPREEAAAHGRAEGTDAKQPELQQREGRACRMDPIARDQRQGERQQADDLAGPRL